MTRSFAIVRTALFVIFALPLLAGAAAAQSAVYVTGSVFADVKRFGETQNVPYFGGDDEFSLDGTGAGGGLRIGTFLNPRWSLELSVDAGARTQGKLPNSYVVILAIYPPPFPELTASTKFVAVSTLVGFHPPARGRVQMGYLVGFSFISGTYKSDYPSFLVPVPLFASAETAIATRPVIFPPPSITIRRMTQKQNTGGAILGFEAAITLRNHLAIVPEIRALTFSTINHGPGVFLIRPGVGVRWSF